MRLPSSRLQTIVLIMYYGLLVRLRGLRFRERSDAQITAAERTRMNACWSLAMVLGFVETYVGLIFQRRALLLALAAGDLDRITRAVAIGVGFSAIEGGPASRRTDRRLLPRRIWLTTRPRTGTRVRSSREGPCIAVQWSASERQQNTSHAHWRASSRMAQPGLCMNASARCSSSWTRWPISGGSRSCAAPSKMGCAMHRREGTSTPWSACRLVARISVAHVDDRPDLAKGALRTAMDRWSTRDYNRQHCGALLSHLCGALYSGEAENGHELGRGLGHQTRRSLLWRIQEIRLRVLSGHGGAALALVADRMGDRERLLREAANDARAIERERMAWMQPFAKCQGTRRAIAITDEVRDETGTRVEEEARLIAKVSDEACPVL